MRRNLLPSLDIAEYVTPKQFLLQPVKTVVLAPPVTNMTRIIIGCPWQLFSNDYEINMKSDARVTYFASLRFADSFYEVFKALTQIYIRKARSSVPAYSAVHFRIEDDFIRHKHFKMNKLESYYFLFLYIKLIRTKVPNRKEPIFLQTGLRPADSLYFGLKYLKHFFPNAIVLDKAAFIARLPDAKLRAPPVHPGGVSQIRAIFDMISAQSSRVFIGSRESTFSWWCAHSKTPLGSVVKDGAAPSVFLINRKEAIANKTAIALFENSSGYLMLKSFVPLK